MKNKKNWKFFKGLNLYLISLSFLINYLFWFIGLCVVIKNDLINGLSFSLLALLSFNSGIIIGDYIKLGNIKSRSEFMKYTKLWSKFINDEE